MSVNSVPAVLAVGTAVPPYVIEQGRMGAWVGESLGASPQLRRWLRHLYDRSGIETRHSCLPEAVSLPFDSPYAPGKPLEASPTTAQRMAVYERASVEYGAEAAGRALDGAGVDPATVSHLIVVSCTGFFAPGLDFAVARRLGLSPNVQRTLVGFMGCAAAFNALRLASQIVAADPSARVLVVCVELCTLHLQPGDGRINLTVASLFADGAAACLVAAPTGRAPALLLNSFFTEVTPETEDAMAWQIGDHGFVMKLSPQVPRHIGVVARPALEALLGGRPAPAFWAMHPGGRAILDQLVAAFGLTPPQAAASYEVLRRYGNMSSPSILFVLHELLGRLAAGGEQADGVAVAFGPGLVTEMAHLTYVPATTLELPERRPAAVRGGYVA